ncbi:hypothetical protein QQ008_06270 [Fulvivirgaceae bacterium BMA10]|uniref:Uncharacterized protein n=1 Tax=Splendidivirga corallicola TaxID=3051826 RepID=A0ABT8KL53_9BACT|nr:hypothetical protein [Fulvivirgaceae bacterium BMA10]
MKKQLSKTFYDLFGIQKEFTNFDVATFCAVVLVVTSLVFVMIKETV